MTKKSARAKSRISLAWSGLVWSGRGYAEVLEMIDATLVCWQHN